jgi:hypothetical protein
MRVNLPVEVAMADEYRIRLVGSQFEIIDDAGDRVGAFRTEREAKHEIDVLVSDDAMWKSARLLVQAAVSAFMNMRHVDSRTAQHWIREAAD